MAKDILSDMSDIWEAPKNEGHVGFQRRLEQMRQEVNNIAERDMDVAIRVLRKWIAGNNK